MAHTKALDVRSKMIGVLMRGARLRAGKTLKGCADLLACSPRTISQYEQGRGGISLPELELLASFFDVPVSYFWEEGYDVPEVGAELPPGDKFIPLRRKMIGVLLRQARLEAGKSQKECAKIVDVSADTMSRYEYGKKPIPFAHLETLASFLNVPLYHFVDRELAGTRLPVTRAGDELLSAEDAWPILPAEIQEFIRNPESLPYLLMALSLYELPKDSLQHLAEAILSITD